MVDILILVDMFNIPNLATSIAAHIEGLISLSNGYSILEVSRRLKIESLAETCLLCLERSASEILLHDDFTTLSQVNFNNFTQYYFNLI